MSKYEMSVVIKPNLDEETLKTEFEKVTGHIERFGGVVEKVDEWGKRRLAYEIQKITEGIYYFITFEAPTSAPAEIESRVRIMENVLRYLIINVEA